MKSRGTLTANSNLAPLLLGRERCQRTRIVVLKLLQLFVISQMIGAKGLYAETPTATPLSTPMPSPSPLSCLTGDVPDNVDVAREYLAHYPETSTLINALPAPRSVTITRINDTQAQRQTEITDNPLNDEDIPFRSIGIKTNYDCTQTGWKRKKSTLTYNIGLATKQNAHGKRSASGTIVLDAALNELSFDRKMNCELDDYIGTIQSLSAYPTYHTKCRYSADKCEGNSAYERPDLILPLQKFTATYGERQVWAVGTGYTTITSDQMSQCDRGVIFSENLNKYFGGTQYQRRVYSQFGPGLSPFSTSSKKAHYPDQGYSEISVTSETLTSAGQPTGQYFKYIGNNDLQLNSNQSPPQNGLVSSFNYWGECNASSSWSCPYLAPEMVNFKVGWTGAYAKYTGLFPYTMTGCTAGSPMEATVVARVTAYQNIATSLKALPAIELPTGCAPYVK